MENYRNGKISHAEFHHVWLKVYGSKWRIFMALPEWVFLWTSNAENLNSLSVFSKKIQCENKENSAETDSRSQTQNAEKKVSFLHSKKYLKQITEIKRVRSLQTYEEFGIKLYTKYFNYILQV
jgi:hypothetical protein